MSIEEKLLEKWRTSNPTKSVLKYDYSIDGQSVRLSITRVAYDVDLRGSIIKTCVLNCDSINAAIEELSKNKESLSQNM